LENPSRNLQENLGFLQECPKPKQAKEAKPILTKTF